MIEKMQCCGLCAVDVSNVHSLDGIDKEFCSDECAEEYLSSKRDKTKQIDNLVIMESLQDAIRIIHATQKHLANGSMTLWRILNHAENHLDKQIAEMLAVSA